MKIELDTKNKTITIKEDINLHDLYEELNNILPDGKWREFDLKKEIESKTIPYTDLWYEKSTTIEEEEGDYFNYNIKYEA